LPDDLQLTVSELFYSIQGESDYAGYPCVFIRLAGCNLRCNYCDARYTYEEPGRPVILTELLQYARLHPAVPVEITGGEPLLQENVYTFMEQLLADGRTVLLETNGSMDLAKVPTGVVKIMDLKCPDSGMHTRMRFENLQHLGPTDAIKFVLSSRRDYDWAVQAVNAHRLLPGEVSFGKEPTILFSPVSEKLPPDQLARWLLADGWPIKLQVQLHKILWPLQSRGV